MEAINSFTLLFGDVWKEGIFGLNASEIIIGLIIFLIFYVLRRLFARFLISRLNKIVSKTSTGLDDTVVHVIEGPLKFLPVVLGFFVASSYISFSLELQNFIDLINRTLITIFIFWLLHQLVIPFSFIIKKFEDKISLPVATPKSDPCWFGFPISVRKESNIDRNELSGFLEEDNIETRTLFGGNLIRQPAFKDVKYRKIGNLENTDFVMENTFFIGVYPGIDDRQIEYVLDSFKKFFGGK